jgi:hypothetical protein
MLSPKYTTSLFLQKMLSLRHTVLRVVVEASGADANCKICRCLADISDALNFSNMFECTKVLLHLLRRSFGAKLCADDVCDLPERLQSIVYNLPVLSVPELAEFRCITVTSKLGHSQRNNFIRLVRVTIQNHSPLWVRSMKKGDRQSQG